MKRTIFSVLAVVVLAGLTGCITQHGRRPWACMGGSCAQAPENCQSCGEACDNGTVNGTDPGNDPGSGAPCPACRGLGCRLCRGWYHPGGPEGPEGQEAAPGPATGAVTYPYYTVRGPRDFLAKNPPSIGP